MKILILIDASDGAILVQRQAMAAGAKEALLECKGEPRTAEDVARLVAKIVGIAVAEAITGGGE